MNKLKIGYEELKQMYLDFFKGHGHAVINSASLIPENDPTVLFTTAGMQPLVPYLLGAKHPAGDKLTDVQKCIRTGDIAEVGDRSHLTFFEMLGNWSLGSYFKKESISMSYEFLTQVFKIDPKNLAATIFIGEDGVPKDMETYETWKSLGFTDDQLFFYGKSENWWGPAGLTGPCGPDTEIFIIDQSKPKCSDECGPACNCGRYTEIWNNVFMEYNKNPDGTFSKLTQKNVDTGMGLERLFCTINGISDVYTTELFWGVIEHLEKVSGKKYEDDIITFRRIADHVRAATFILGDENGIAPSNTEQGYVLRRLIRSTIRNLKKIDITDFILPTLAEIVINQYKASYVELEKRRDFILNELQKEELLFNRTISVGLREINKVIEKLQKGDVIDSTTAFKLYDTYGFPLEFTEEIALEHGLKVDSKGFDALFAEHQEKSRKGAEKKFKGGLADSSEETTKLHTTTHILHKVLRDLLGDHVAQKGSNITAERLRFDFSFERKVTPEELAIVEERVNEVISRDLPVSMEEMSFEEAQKAGAIGLFANKYDIEKVKVYSIGDFSMEVCGGPHVEHTAEIGKFKILKEESSSAGVRRIKASVG
ncbi:MAG: alanine--tRNA ligase [Alphaproteobacteria bacterium]|nr:alanine--tRNA ligase [Alphaproteobacteria bacterium]